MEYRRRDGRSSVDMKPDGGEDGEALARQKTLASSFPSRYCRQSDSQKM